MAEETKDQKQFKVYFNGTKKEKIVVGAKFSKFINNLIRKFYNKSFINKLII